MSVCISIINQKGGVAKSTTTNALGAGLFFKGYRVLYVDLDPQGNLTYSMKHPPIKNTLVDVLVGETTIKRAIVKTPQGDLLPSSPDLSTIDLLLHTKNKDEQLKRLLDPIKEEYDFILLDTPPSLGLLTINALVASDRVLTPVQADIFSLQGLGQFIQTFQAVQSHKNKKLKLSGILITRHNPRTTLSKDMVALFEETAIALNTKVFPTPIRESVTVKEAQSLQVDLFTYKPKSNVAKDYIALIDEIINQE